MGNLTVWYALLAYPNAGMVLHHEAAVLNSKHVPLGTRQGAMSSMLLDRSQFLLVESLTKGCWCAQA